MINYEFQLCILNLLMNEVKKANPGNSSSMKSVAVPHIGSIRYILSTDGSPAEAVTKSSSFRLTWYVYQG